MKTTLFLFLALFALCQTQAQIVNIPDPNFKNALLNHTNPVIDTNNDGEIQVHEAEAITETLNVSDQNIQDLTGIEAFTNLESLWCSGNPLTQLDVSQNVELETLICQSTLLTELDMSNNINLIYLICNYNQLTVLDLRNGSFEVEIITVNNPNLTCIFVDDANYADNASFWYEDPTATYVETQAECDAMTGVEDFFSKKIKVYPNPVRKKLYINSEYKIQNSELFIRNLLGKKVYHATLLSQQSKFDLSHLSSGIYFLNIHKNSTNLLTIKIIKL